MPLSWRKIHNYLYHCETCHNTYVGNKHFDMLGQRRTFTCGVRSIDVKEKYIKPTRVFELEDGVSIYRNRRR